MVAAGAAGASGAAGGSSVTYVDDVFSTFLYEGNSSTQKISNGIRLGDAISGLSGYSIYSTQGINYTSTAGASTWQEIITNGSLSGNNSDYVYSDSSVLDIYVDLVDAAVATAVKIAPQGDPTQNVTYNTPTSLTVYGSDDASSWTTLDTNTGLTASNFHEGSFTTFSFSNSTAYRYYRIATPAYTSISEWELVATLATPAEGGLVWIKNRSTGNTYHALYDTERGTERYLYTNGNGAEYYYANNGVTSFNSNGFTVKGTSDWYGLSGENICSWTFRKAPGFFDVVTWTGDGVNGRQISHSLGSTPGMSIIKCTTTSARDWIVRHQDMSSGKVCFLNTADSELTNLGGYQTHSSTHLTLNSGSAGLLGVNNSGDTYVAYIFAHDDQSFGTNSDEAIIKCGSYTGDGSSGNAEGNLQNLGFEPQWLMIKNASSTLDPHTGWFLFDNMRGVTYGKGTTSPTGDDQYLHANKADDELTDAIVNFTSVGFSLTNSGYNLNKSGDTYIYMAIRRPHKPPTFGTEVFATDTGNNSANGPAFDSNFPVDLGWYTRPANPDGMRWESRITGGKYMGSFSLDGENVYSDSWAGFDDNNGWGLNFGTNYRSWMFRRAPGFMDVVTYTGDGTINRTIPHNLEVVPELVIAKRRTSSGEWWVDADAAESGKILYLSRENTAFSYTAFGTHTATTIGLETVQNNDTNHNTSIYIAYLFASLDGISKVGSYTGTGNNINVDCGFAAGARFILIKRTDSTGDWYVWDTGRGINSGNYDPYYLINEANQEVVNTDYLEPLNAGFTVKPGSADLNTSGGTYLFLAIA